MSGTHGVFAFAHIGDLHLQGGGDRNADDLRAILAEIDGLHGCGLLDFAYLPGDLAEDGRALFTVALGLTLSLFVSGCIEGFVTPSPLPWPVKIGIGALALAGFLFYMLFVGGRAVRAGETGDLDPFAAGARRIVAD